MSPLAKPPRPPPGLRRPGQLLNDRNAERYRRDLTAGIDRVAARLTRTERPFTGITPARLAAEIAAVDLDVPLGDPPRHSTNSRRSTPRRRSTSITALPRPPQLPGGHTGPARRAVLAAVNSSLDTWDQSAGATLIERRVIDWTADASDSVPTPTGSSPAAAPSRTCRRYCWPATEACELAAKNAPRHWASTRSCPGCASSPRRSATSASAPPPNCSASARTPSSAVECDRERRMRPAALAREIDRCRSADELVMAVVATAGTTDFGSSTRCRRSRTCAGGPACGCT